MEQLFTIVPPSANADDCQKTAIVGLGGVGKTQIALEVAFRLREQYPDSSIFWVPAIDAVNFQNPYRRIGQLLGIPGINDDKADVEEIVKNALSNESAGNWFMIVDNADDPDLFDGGTYLSRQLPFSRQGSLLFTSRNREAIVQLDVPSPNIVTIEGMSEDEGLKFLEIHLTSDQMANRDDTSTLLDLLGYLPLAIRQASAYMAKKQISTAQYLEYCRSSDKTMVELLSRDFEDRHRYREAQNPVATTWLISFREIADHDPLAAEYLKFMCFLNEKAIPRSLLPSEHETLEAEDALGTLKAYAFITERGMLEVYDMHRLVRLEMLNWLGKQGELEEWTVKVIQRVEETFPTPDYENKEEWVSYLPHILHVLERQTTVSDMTAQLHLKAGRSFFILGQFRQAEEMYQKELEGREKMHGSDHPDALTCISNVGLALYSQGKYERAETMHRRASEGRESMLGQNHADTLTSVFNLGNTLQSQGQSKRQKRCLDGHWKDERECWDPVIHQPLHAPPLWALPF